MSDLWGRSNDMNTAIWRPNGQHLGATATRRLLSSESCRMSGGMSWSTRTSAGSIATTVDLIVLSMEFLKKRLRHQPHFISLAVHSICTCIACEHHWRSVVCVGKVSRARVLCLAEQMQHHAWIEKRTWLLNIRNVFLIAYKWARPAPQCRWWRRAGSAGPIRRSINLRNKTPKVTDTEP